MRVALITNIVPHYREDFLRRVQAEPDLELTVFCQESISGVHVEPIVDRRQLGILAIPAWRLPGDQLVWHRLPWQRLWAEFDVLVFSGNLRTLSTVLAATALRLLGRKVVIWGPAQVAGAARLQAHLRWAWWRCFPTLLLYTSGEAEQLRQQGFASKRLWGLENGLDQRGIDAVRRRWEGARLARWRIQQGLLGRPVLLSCSRLIPRNRFELLVQALPGLRRRFPGLLWCAVGDGPSRPALHGLARSLGLQDSIRWLGALHDEEALAPWFLSAGVLVHPHAIGLTLLHGLGYGLPVVTDDDLRAHGPEYAALEPERTGFVYPAGDTAALAEVIARCLQLEGGQRRQVREAGLHLTRTVFNTETMASRFCSCVREAAATCAAPRHPAKTKGSSRRQ